MHHLLRTGPLLLLAASACIAAPPRRQPLRTRVGPRACVIALGAAATPPPSDEGAEPLNEPLNDGGEEDPGTGGLSQSLNEELKRRSEAVGAAPGIDDFNSDLYEHLRRRPEFLDRELSEEFSTRVDVSENVFNSWREQVNATTRLEPTVGQTPGEAIELVLRALQDCDYPVPGHGVTVFQRFSSSVSISSEEKMNMEMLYRYLKKSKFEILLEWVTVMYTKKLEISYGGKRAYQELRLRSARSGDWFVLNCMLSLSDDGLWLIDHIRVRGAKGDYIDEPIDEAELMLEAEMEMEAEAESVAQAKKIAEREAEQTE